jgi:SAM-dependent methyltransferase
VAILVPDVEGYLLHHVKGISKVVKDSAIPASIRADFAGARRELAHEHIEEDLESDRVNALYLMNHYFRVKGEKNPWWRSVPASESPLISSLIEQHWDHGPMETVARWLPEGASVVELGSGVGGLCERVKERAGSYLGVDSSFLSVLIARHLHLGGPFPGGLRYPGDLLYGNLSKRAVIKLSKPEKKPLPDFIVGDMDSAPVAGRAFDVCVTMNAIDMLDDPAALPRTQGALVKKGGSVIGTAPYIWHEKVAKKLRSSAFASADSSAAVVEGLYEKAGLSIERRELHIPWLFFKHLRQLEIYSVHAVLAKKS